MSSTASAPARSERTERIAIHRRWWAGPLAIIASVVANLIVRFIALAVFDIPGRFSPLANPGPVIALTTLGVAGAVIVFAIVSRFARHPARLFRVIALVVLLLSFLPDLRLLKVQGATVPAVGTLMFMHIVAAAISVGLLTARAPKE